LKASHRAESFGSIRGTRNGSGASSRACPVSKLRKITRDFVSIQKKTSIPLKWIVLTLFLMTKMLPRMGEKELFSIKFGFAYHSGRTLEHGLCEVNSS
jgi:hypothetical protein